MKCNAKILTHVCWLKAGHAVYLLLYFLLTVHVCARFDCMPCLVCLCLQYKVLTILAINLKKFTIYKCSSCWICWVRNRSEKRSQGAWFLCLKPCCYCYNLHSVGWPTMVGILKSLWAIVSNLIHDLPRESERCIDVRKPVFSNRF